MKALILAAGFGKRLLPHTQVKPKPMFTVDSKPVIDHTIEKLIKAGCSEIIINTHHLHDQIENYIKENTYPVKVETIFEPEILNTGGAVKNVRTFVEDSTFMVINSDILFDNIDLTQIFKTHCDDNHLASLVLHKHEKFNMIEIDNHSFIKNFNSSKNPYAFTGIQILSPKIFKLMPNKNIFSIIELYESLIKNDCKINAIILKDNYFWEDMGSIEAYKHSCMKYLSASTESQNHTRINKIKIQKLKGDGSDREWFRITAKNKTYIAADHGIRKKAAATTCQFDSFINIGSHLYNNGLPVPKIYNHDIFSGIAIVEDLGDTHLESILNSLEHEEEILTWYKKVCDSLFSFSFNGFKGFKKQWTFETEEYSKKVILERECKYFIDAFLNTYLKKNIEFETYLTEFEFIADNCINSSFTGLMHRDMQSKNIMIKNNSVFFIDFQSARKGPLEYDMASLLIDPYVRLSNNLKNKILNYFLNMITTKHNIDAKHFKHCYKYCCVARNLQILGAFSYLSKVKNKKNFEDFIPYALSSLKKHINLIDIKKTQKLNKLINNLKV